MKLRLPTSHTALAAALMLAAAPFAFAVPPGTAPGATGATPPAAEPGTAPGATTMPPPATPNGYRSTTPYGARSGQSENGQNGYSNGYSNRSYQEGRTGAAGATSMSLRVPQRDIHAAKNVKVSLSKAIHKAEQNGHGKAIEARFELMNGKPEYLVKTVSSSQHKEWITHVNAKSGKVVGQAHSVKTNRLMPESQQEITAANNASTSLLQAVKKAENQENGKAIAAGMTARYGTVTYRTEILNSNGQTKMASINPQTGKVSTYR